MSTRPGLPKVNEERTWQDAVTLAQWVRLSGTPDYERAAQYVVSELRQAGISVTVHRPKLHISYPGAAELETVAPRVALQCITHAHGATTAGAWVEGEVASAGTAAVAGRVAVASGLANPGAIVRAQRAGALAIVFVNKGNRRHELGISPVWGTPTPATLGELPRIPVLSVGRDEGGQLLAGAERGGLRVRLRAEVQTGWVEAALPVATIAGATDDEWLLVGGHLDSWHYGAMDNAFGNATCLEIARLLQAARGSLRRTVRVAWWPGHSDGRFGGSTWFADNHWESLSAGCVGYLNIDQPGFKEFGEFSLMSSPEWGTFLQTTARARGFRVPEIAPIGRHADMSFVGVGVPACDFQPRCSPGDPAIGPDRTAEKLPWYWHHTDDTLDKGDPAILAAHTAVLAAAAYETATRPILPFDVRAYVAAFGEALAQAPAAEPVDAIRTALGEFERGAEALMALAERAEGAQVAAVNNAFRRISRALIPALYSPGPRFEHWPAMHTPVLPGLELLHGGAEPTAAMAAFVRYRNMVVAGLGEAAAACRTLVGAE